MRQSYLKTIETMDLVYQTEIQRTKMPEDLFEDLQLRNLAQHIERFEYIFELTAGKGRESYMHRAHLEFPQLTRVDIDKLDKYVNARKFSKQKEKAVVREWRKEKLDLKQKTMNLIEQQVEETSQRLKQEFESAQFNRQRE